MGEMSKHTAGRGGTPGYYGKGVETISKQEHVVRALVASGMDPARAFDAATALKYSDRAGEKTGEAEDKDMRKCASYLFRAARGMWPWEAEATERDEV